MYENVLVPTVRLEIREENGTQLGRSMILKSRQCRANLQQNFNCLHMLDETVEQFINRLNDICATIVNDPGEAIKKTQVIRGIETNLLHLPRLKQDMSWAEYCTSIKDQAMQFADISLFCDKRKQMIGAEQARQSSSNRFEGDKDCLNIEDSVKFASDSVQNKKRESETRSSVRCWKCGRNGHKSFELIARRGRRIGVEMLTKIKGGSTRSCGCVLRTVMGQSDGCISDHCRV